MSDLHSSSPSANGNLPTVDLTIVIPAYNEAENIENVVLESRYILDKADLSGEILVVNDGSTDSTGQILDRLKETVQGFRILHHSTNRGIAAAMINGYSKALGEFVFFNSADEQCPMSHLLIMMPVMKTVDIAVGYFVERHDSNFRIVLSWCYRILVQLLFGIRLHNINALKLFRREVFDPQHRYSNSFCIDLELILWAISRGYRVAEVPVEHFPRSGGKSNVTRFWGYIHTFYHLINLWYRRRFLW